MSDIKIDRSERRSRTEILYGCHVKSPCESEGSCAASLYRSLARSPCAFLASSCSYCRAYRSAISPRPLCLLCISAWQPQNRRKTCSSIVSLTCSGSGLRVVSISAISPNLQHILQLLRILQLRPSCHPVGLLCCPSCCGGW